MAVQDVKDAALLDAILAGATVKAAAEKAGIPERTAYRRLAEEGLRSQLDESRRAIAAAVLAYRASQAVRVAELQFEMLTSSDTPAAVRRNLMRDWFDDLERFGEARDLGERMGEIEQLLERVLGKAAA